MCCFLDQVNGRFVPQAIAFKEFGEEKKYYIKGVIDHTPTTLTRRVSRFFQRLELLEKIAEIVDESFHLLGSVFHSYTSLTVYQTLHNLHHNAHDIEHFLHSFCFLGDLFRVTSALLGYGNFFEYKDSEHKQLDYLRSAARVCHTVSHFFATASFISEIKLIRFGLLEQRVFKYAALVSSLGYALWTASLLWNRHQGQLNKQFKSDLTIHFCGFIFEALPLTKTLKAFISHSFLINKITALAGIIHAWSMVKRLMPQDREEVEGKFIIPLDLKAEDPLKFYPLPEIHHDDHHDHHH